MTVPARRLRRLLVPLPSAGLGGAEAHTASLIRALAATGVGISVAASPALLKGLAALLGGTAALHAAPIDWREAEDPATNAARQSRALAPLLARLVPDAALLPLPWPSHGLGLQAALAAEALPTLVIAHLAPHEPEPVPAPLRVPLEAAPFAWAAVSRPVAQSLAASFGLQAHAVTVIPNAVEVPPADPARRHAQREKRRAGLGLSSAAPLVIFAGRLEEKKGADLLPALAERLRDQAGATLAVLGTGPLAMRLAQHPAARQPGPLHLLGQVTDVADWLLAGDVLVLPSRLEGCPLIALEAMALGCPIVATAAAMEGFSADAQNLASIVAEPSVVGLTTHLSVLLTKMGKELPTNAATLAHLRLHNFEFMLERYFALLRTCLAESGQRYPD